MIEASADLTRLIRSPVISRDDQGRAMAAVLDKAGMCTLTQNFVGTVAETVAINPALAISGIEILNQWYYRPDYMAIMSNCANTQIGVWSENSLDRTVVVAVGRVQRVSDPG